MDTKICSKCKRILSVDNYYKNNSSKDKLYAYCKECSKNALQQYGKLNKERVQTLRKQYVIDNKANLQQYNKQYGKQYYEIHRKENRDSEIERLRKYREDNKEKTSTYGKKYRKENKDKINILTNKHRATKRLLPATLTNTQWSQIELYFNNCCCYCGKELPLEQEHFIALTKGGEYTTNNIICACRSCNASKSNKIFEEWYPTYQYYSIKREKTILDFLNYKNNV